MYVAVKHPLLRGGGGGAGPSKIWHEWIIEGMEKMFEIGGGGGRGEG